MTFPSENRRDVELYLRAYFAARPGHGWLARYNKNLDEAVALLSERSEDNFMYLKHVLPHLDRKPEDLQTEDYKLEDFAPEKLPRGLTQYYLRHWDRMTERWRGRPEAEYVFDTVYVLAKARKPMTRRQIKEALSNAPQQLVGTFIGQWREFLEEFKRDERTYRIYHASFADFLAKQDAVIDAGRDKKAARLLKNWFLTRLRQGAGSA